MDCPHDPEGDPIGALNWLADEADAGRSPVLSPAWGQVFRLAAEAFAFIDASSDLAKQAEIAAINLVETGKIRREQLNAAMAELHVKLNGS